MREVGEELGLSGKGNFLKQGWTLMFVNRFHAKLETGSLQILMASLAVHERLERGMRRPVEDNERELVEGADRSIGCVEDHERSRLKAVSERNDDR